MDIKQVGTIFTDSGIEIDKDTLLGIAETKYNRLVQFAMNPTGVYSMDLNSNSTEEALDGGEVEESYTFSLGFRRNAGTNTNNGWLVPLFMKRYKDMEVAATGDFDDSLPLNPLQAARHLAAWCGVVSITDASVYSAEAQNFTAGSAGRLSNGTWALIVNPRHRKAGTALAKEAIYARVYSYLDNLPPDQLENLNPLFETPLFDGDMLAVHGQMEHAAKYFAELFEYYATEGQQIPVDVELASLLSRIPVFGYPLLDVANQYINTSRVAHRRREVASINGVIYDPYRKSIKTIEETSEVEKLNKRGWARRVSTVTGSPRVRWITSRLNTYRANLGLSLVNSPRDIGNWLGQKDPAFELIGFATMMKQALAQWDIPFSDEEKADVALEMLELTTLIQLARETTSMLRHLLRSRRNPNIARNDVLFWEMFRSLPAPLFMEYKEALQRHEVSSDLQRRVDTFITNMWGADLTETLEMFEARIVEWTTALNSFEETYDTFEFATTVQLDYEMWCDIFRRQWESGSKYGLLVIKDNNDRNHFYRRNYLTPDALQNIVPLKEAVIDTLISTPGNLFMPMLDKTFVEGADYNPLVKGDYAQYIRPIPAELGRSMTSGVSMKVEFNVATSDYKIKYYAYTARGRRVMSAAEKSHRYAWKGVQTFKDKFHETNNATDKLGWLALYTSASALKLSASAFRLSHTALNPHFWVLEFLLDSYTAGLRVHAVIPVIFRALFKLLHLLGSESARTEFAKLREDAQFERNAMNYRFNDSYEQDMQKYIDAATKDTIATILHPDKVALSKKAYGGLTAIQSLLEAIPRVAAAESLEAQLRRAGGYSEEDIRELTVLAAQTTMDFNMQLPKWVRGSGTIIAYFTAWFRVLDVFYEANVNVLGKYIKENPNMYSEDQKQRAAEFRIGQLKSIASTVLIMILLEFVRTITGYLWGGRKSWNPWDDEGDTDTWAERSNRYIIHLPNNHKLQFKVLPAQLHVLLASFMHVTDTVENWEDFLGALVTSFAPPATPAPFSIVQLWTNKDSYGDTIFTDDEKDIMEANDIDFYQDIASGNELEISRAISAWWNNTFGEGLFEAMGTPKGVDYVLRSLLGGWYYDISAIEALAGVDKKGSSALDIELSAFGYKEENRSAYSEEFWELYRTESTKATKILSPEEAEKRLMNGEDLSRYTITTSTEEYDRLRRNTRFLNAVGVKDPYISLYTNADGKRWYYDVSIDDNKILSSTLTHNNTVDSVVAQNLRIAVPSPRSVDDKLDKQFLYAAATHLVKTDGKAFRPTDLNPAFTKPEYVTWARGLYDIYHGTLPVEYNLYEKETAAAKNYQTVSSTLYEENPDYRTTEWNNIKTRNGYITKIRDRAEFAISYGSYELATGKITGAEYQKIINYSESMIRATNLYQQTTLYSIGLAPKPTADVRQEDAFALVDATYKNSDAARELTTDDMVCYTAIKEIIGIA